MSSAADIARRMEQDAVAFYKKAADSASSPAGKQIFLTIMEDEVRHIKMVDSLIKDMGIDDTPADPTERVKTVFEQMKDQLNESIAATDGDKDALKTAMSMEIEGYVFYLKSADEATDPKVADFFKRLASEEDKHYRMFSNTFDFLDDTGNWFMWEERGIIEG